MLIFTELVNRNQFSFAALELSTNYMNTYERIIISLKIHRAAAVPIIHLRVKVARGFSEIRFYCIYVSILIYI